MEQVENAIKEFMGQSVTMVNPEDEFGFKCQQCGSCCTNRRDILLNPFDIYNGAKYLGIKPEEFLLQFTYSELGHTLKIPIVLLKPANNGFCPLLELDFKDGCKFKCKIHPAKPGACANHPIGVAFSKNIATGEEEMSFIKVEQCPNSVSTEMHKVSDWTKDYMDNLEDIKAAHEVQMAVREIMDPEEFVKTLALIGILYENETVTTPALGLTIKESVTQVLDTYALATVHLGYGEYDINRPFAEQAKENIVKLKEIYTDMNKFYINVKEKLEQTTGKTIDEHIEALKNILMNANNEED